MSSQNNPTLSEVEIHQALSSADQLARSKGDSLKEKHPDWVAFVETLSEDKCPVTYLPVAAVLLLARAIRSKDQVNVLHIQKQTSDYGFSAPSLGKALIPFAIQQGINLRTTSSQVMNNQPFTFKAEILPEMAAPRFYTEYKVFFEGAQRINGLESADALEILALVFALRRKSAHEQINVEGFHADSQLLKRVSDIVVNFVESNSESGKVGQVLAAALFDALYPGSTIRMGNNNDPSSKVPGDVQVGDAANYWLWAEVKQKPVVTPEIESFIDKISAVMGYRGYYFALVNAPYPQNINQTQVAKHATKKGVVFDVYQSPEEAVDALLRVAPGSNVQVAENFVNAFSNRLFEANVTNVLLNEWLSVIAPLTGN